MKECFLEASLNGEQTIIVPQYYRELQNIAFELHLLNVCKSNDEKRKTICKKNGVSLNIKIIEGAEKSIPSIFSILKIAVML